MRRSAAPALLLGALLGLPQPARGAVEGSPHDVIAQEYDSSKTGTNQDRCNRCHLPVPTSGPSLLQQIPPVLSGYTASTLLCFSCHDGTTIVSPEVDASATAFHPRSHSMGLSAGSATLPEDLALPHAHGARQECVTCHDPHTNNARPFLRTGMDELCILCHPGQIGGVARGKENLVGNHPMGADLVKAARREVPIAVDAPLRVPFPASYPQRKGKSSTRTHWDLGGHLGSGDTGAVGCVTCHAVHGDELAPPKEFLLALDPVNVEANVFCEACHRGSRGDEKPAPPYPNPGATTTGRTYHPVDDDLANGDGRLVAIREPSAWPFGQGSPRRLVCTTCHRTHGAWERTPLLRRPTTAATFCEECHAEVPEQHHPLAAESTGRCIERLPGPEYGEGRGIVGCELCHRAHNAGFDAEKTAARELDFVPLLRDNQLTDQLCSRCHPPDNPTCGKKPEGLASHFVGDSTLPETYGNVTPPMRRTPWPESGLPSLYGGETQKVMLCLSCHTFRKGAVVSGDAGKSRFLLARSGNNVEWAEDEGIYLCTGCHTANPGTTKNETDKKGHSHPSMAADILKLGRPPDPPTTATINGHINCDSCHRPHEAVTKGAYYILEVVASENTDPKLVHPTIDFTVICHRCHDPGKY
jgi:predicted CXXCH cytochrome family protein